jgi:O-antigen/teichoic acid export membrane protein
VLVLTDRVVALTVYNVSVSVAIAAATIAAMALTGSYFWPIAARIAMALIALPIGLWLMLAGTERFRMPEPAKMAAIVRYSAPLGLAFMIGAITLQIHAIIVSLLCTPEQFAVYVNGAMEIPLINAVVGAITTIALADMAARVAQGRHLEALELFKSATTSAAFIVFPATVYFALAAYPFIVFLFSDKYADSTVPFLIYLLAAPARVAVYGSALMALGMNRPVLIRTVIDLTLMTSISLAGVYYFGPNGAAWALVISLYGFTIPYCLYFIAKGYGVSWTMVMPWRSLAVAAAVAAGCAPIPALSIYLLSADPPVVQLAVSAMLYGLSYLAILLRMRIVSLPPFLARRLPPRA